MASLADLPVAPSLADTGTWLGASGLSLEHHGAPLVEHPAHARFIVHGQAQFALLAVSIHDGQGDRAILDFSQLVHAGSAGLCWEGDRKSRSLKFEGGTAGPAGGCCHVTFVEIFYAPSLPAPLQYSLRGMAAACKGKCSESQEHVSAGRRA